MELLVGINLIQNRGKSEKVKTVKCHHCSERIAELEVNFWGYVSIESGKAIPDAGLKIRCSICGVELDSNALEESGIVLPVLNQLAGLDQEEPKIFFDKCLLIHKLRLHLFCNTSIWISYRSSLRRFSSI